VGGKDEDEAVAKVRAAYARERVRPPQLATNARAVLRAIGATSTPRPALTSGPEIGVSGDSGWAPGNAASTLVRTAQTR
jgi:hypothetical protein